MHRGHYGGTVSRTPGFIFVRETLNGVFGADSVHFTARRDGASFPCAVWALDSETVQPMISDPHHVLSIDVTIDVQDKKAKVAQDLAEEVRVALGKGRHIVLRTAYDVDEFRTDQAVEPKGTPKTLFIASATYTVRE